MGLLKGLFGSRKTRRKRRRGRAARSAGDAVEDSIEGVFGGCTGGCCLDIPVVLALGGVAVRRYTRRG
ncbi:MAG: hypothetical protein M3375_01960 [Actinomycetota bacterium]|nr:hypothetical protein [Actinomycetota bacterium]